MEMKINDRKERNRDATVGRIAGGGPSQARVAPRYFFLSIFVMVSPDCVKET